MQAEDKYTEYKREYTEEIKKTVVAFANTDGGTLYIGIEDDGSVCGVEDVDGTLLKVTNAIRDAIRPDVTLFTDCSVQQREGRTILVLRVQRGTARPYYLAGKGIRPEGVYVRQGASKVPATEAAILRMIKETGGDSYEETRSLRQQLTFEDTMARFARRSLPFGEAQRRTLRLIGEDGTYTNLALLLSEQCEHSIKLAVFEGTVKTVFKERRELSGSLLRQAEDAFSFLDRYNRTRGEYSGLERIDTRDYPVEALREALLNALVHRDYGFGGPTLLSIFDDRIELVSIGGLVRGISMEDILLGVSILRNPHLANIFYRLGLIEAYGTGMMKIQSEYADSPVKPKIETSDNAFKLTLPNRNYAREAQPTASKPAASAAMGGQEQALLTLLKNSGGPLARRHIQAALGISQSSAILLLRTLQEKGLIQKEGSGRNTTYRLPRQ